METWQSILLAFGGNAALLTVLGLFGKALIEKYIQKDLKQFEIDLNNKSEIAIQALTSDLKIKALEHEIRFSSLHAKRAEVIEQLYKLLVAALWSVEDFLNPMEWAGEPNRKEKYPKAMNSLVDLFRYFDSNQIYLPAKLCDSLLAMIEALRVHAIHSSVYLKYDESNATLETLEQKYQAFEVGWKAIKIEIPSARKALENEFRTLLGSAPNQSFNPDVASVSHIPSDLAGISVSSHRAASATPVDSAR